MNTMTQEATERDRAARMELAQRIGRALPLDGTADPLPGLSFARSSSPTDRVHGVSVPSLCVIAQGAKEVALGDRHYRYDPEHYMLFTVELPLTGRVVAASNDHPYLSMKLELDESLVGSVMIEAGLATPPNNSDAKAIVISPFDNGLLDAVVRLIRLIDSPGEARVLLPLIKREIVYRLLIGEQGSRLRNLPRLGGNSDRIAQAVEKLRKNFDQPLRIENLAQDLGMSSSGFHHHFKAVTDMSPLQFQKQLRLQEARRLMLGESLDAASAGYRVGYDDASHFSRDYKKLFGNSPVRDVERLKSMVSVD